MNDEHTEYAQAGLTVASGQKHIPSLKYNRKGAHEEMRIVPDVAGHMH
jgi:hypothetical protein